MRLLLHTSLNVWRLPLNGLMTRFAISFVSFLFFLCSAGKIQRYVFLEFIDVSPSNGRQASSEKQKLRVENRP